MGLEQMWYITDFDLEVSMDLSKKVVLVTGSSRGIGSTVAKEFGERGARVAVHYHEDREAAERTLSQMAGGPHLIVQADVRDPGSVEKLVQAVTKKMERIDILVNNAGIYDYHPIPEISYEQWQEAWQLQIGTNLLGAAHVTFCVVQQMIKQGGGRIVNVSSRGAFRGEPDAPAYGASKAGLNAMSQSLAKALVSKNIFVYVVAPGFVDTKRVAPILAGPVGEAVRRENPFGRVATSEEVANIVLYLASEAPDYMTGSIIDLNGASYLRT
jgi:NAD(P)-dependent dehydrogenase (short-subunit alcohol dehydrogenase family)